MSMITLIVQLLLRAIAVFLAAAIVPGVAIDTFGTAILVALVISLLNFLIKPILFVLTMPITLLTFGLFAVILNVLIIMLVPLVVPGFHLDGFLSALLFGLVLGVISALLFRLR